MNSKDIRWHQRLENFERAFSEFKEGIDLAKTRDLTKLEKQGLIQAFEYTHELAWNTLKDFFVDQGTINLAGSKDTTREAFKLGIIEDGEAWMDMIQSRNLTSHTYNQETADLIVNKVVSTYYALFKKLIDTLKARKQ